MKPALHFEVPGDAVPQPRHRVGTSFAGKPQAYVQSAHPVHAWRDMVRFCAVRAMAAARIRKLITGPLALFVSALLTQPKTKPTHPYPTDPGDLDNFWKPVADSLQKVAYANDSHIINAGQLKRWAPRGVKPSTMVYLFEVPATQLTGGHPSALEVGSFLGLSDRDPLLRSGQQAASPPCESIGGHSWVAGPAGTVCARCLTVLRQDFSGRASECSACSIGVRRGLSYPDSFVCAECGTSYPI